METVFITGANRGIGLELVRKFAGNSFNVIAACRRPQVANALSELAAKHEIKVLKLDVASAEDIERVQADLKGETLDILINNAGVYGGKIKARTVSTMTNGPRLSRSIRLRPSASARRFSQIYVSQNARASSQYPVKWAL